MRPAKKIILSLSTMLLIAIIAAGGTFISILVIKIPYNTEEKAYINDEITITRNEKGFPTVEIKNRDDLYFALGYIHAKDRLNQMEYQRGIATGYAHIFDIDNADKLNRISALIGFERKSLSILTQLKKEETDILSSYCDGVNFIRKNFTGGEKLPRDWAPSDILSILIMREWADSYLNNIELMLNVKESSERNVRKKFRNQKYIRYYNYDQIGHIKTIRAVRDLIEKHIGIFNRGYAVYIPENLHITQSGDSSIFAYQDSLSVYPSWYPLTVKTDNRKIFAITSAGMPFFFAHRDETQLFFHFNINADTQDFFVIETELKDNRKLYKSAGSLKEFETISMPSQPGLENRPDPLRITDKGPVLSDIFSSITSDETVVTLNSVLPGSSYISFLLSIPFENNFNTILTSVRKIDSSPKTYLLAYGDRKMLVKSGEFTPYSTSSLVFKNGNLYTLTANSRINVSSPFRNIEKTGSAISDETDIPYLFRSRFISNVHQNDRFREILPQMRVYNDKRIRDILYDTYSTTGRNFKPLFQTILDSNIITSAKLTRIYFNDWNYNSGNDDITPSIFYSILNNLIEESYKDVFQDDTSSNLRYSWLLYDDIFTELSSNNTDFFNFAESDRIRNREAVFDTAFLNSMRFLNRRLGPYMDEWKWGELIKGHYNINNPHLNYLAYIFRYDDKPISGAPDTIAVAYQDTEFNTLYAESLKGYMNENTMRLTADYSYSTNISSEFYYGRADAISMMNIKKEGKSYRTVIKPVQ